MYSGHTWPWSHAHDSVGRLPPFLLSHETVTPPYRARSPTSPPATRPKTPVEALPAAPPAKTEGVAEAVEGLAE